MSNLPSFDHSTLIPLLEQLSDGVAVAAPNPWRIVFANPTLAHWLRQPADQLRDKPLESIFPPDTRAELCELADRVSQGAASDVAMIGRLQAEGADFRPADIRICRLVAGEQPLLGIVVRRTDASPQTDAATAERRDPLTALPDREFLLRRLAALLRGQRAAADRRFAVLFVDLDNFKQVNDAHGHLMGDRVLREVARRLSRCVRDADDVVRFGGDEFVVLVEGVSGAGEIQSIVARIHAALEKPIALPEGEFTLSLSIGVAEASPEYHSPEDLLRDADRAMYAAKRRHDAAGAGSSARIDAGDAPESGVAR
jgi:diguanylate cyclase (GGDEF)-like protein